MGRLTDKLVHKEGAMIEFLRSLLQCCSFPRRRNKWRWTGAKDLFCSSPSLSPSLYHSLLVLLSFSYIWSTDKLHHQWQKITTDFGNSDVCSALENGRLDYGLKLCCSTSHFFSVPLQSPNFYLFLEAVNHFSLNSLSQTMTSCQLTFFSVVFAFWRSLTPSHVESLELSIIRWKFASQQYFAAF